jgi:hypothetical protein
MTGPVYRCGACDVRALAQLFRFAAMALVLVTALASAALAQPAAAASSKSGPSTPPSRLYCGTDQSGFEDMNGQIALVLTNGPVAGASTVYNLAFPLNGITFLSAEGELLTGQPEAVGSTAGPTLRTVTLSVPPQLKETILPGPKSFSTACCNEQMVHGPDGVLYHAHYSDVIQSFELGPAKKSQVLQSFPQSDVVGMASDGVNIWISKWTERQVGTWDPATNTFTAVFSTPNDAGALAWDTQNGVLWVGMDGGWVIPYNAAGQQLNAGLQPFGSSVTDTIDGLAFVP